MSAVEPSSLIPVGISACLLGQPVRHDGGHKHFRYASEVLSRYFEFRPLCPENGAGLGTPRPTMHLQQDAEGLRLVNVGDHSDHTEAMQGWIDAALPQLAGLRGFLLKAKSPSCGFERIRIYNEAGNVLRHDAQGLFAAALQRAYPLLPVEDEGRLQDDGLRENFIERVFAYDDWCRLTEGGLTAAGLIGFHTRHKFQLLGHCQRTYRELGPLLADLKSEPIEQIAGRYIAAFMAAMRKVISRGDHVNVLHHLAGYLRDSLDETDRRMLAEQISAYGRGEVPLVVPMTLLRLAQRRQPNEYLRAQQYLSPYPDEMGLRNRI